jgi:hypothetical protein
MADEQADAAAAAPPPPHGADADNAADAAAPPSTSSSTPGRRRRENETEHASSSWAQHKRHVVIVTAAGKPVFSRHTTANGDDASASDHGHLASFAALAQALSSVAEDQGGGFLSSVTAGGPLDRGAARVAFAKRGSLLLLAASRRPGEPPAALRPLLDAAHRQLLLVCAGGVEHALRQRPGLDVRELLGEDRPQTVAASDADEAATTTASSHHQGGASALDAALRLLSRQASACLPLFYFGALEPCPGLSAPVRRAAGVALAAALRASGALYGLVAAVPVVVGGRGGAAAAPWLLPLPAGEHRPLVVAAERGPLPMMSAATAAAATAPTERLAPLPSASDLQALMLLLQSSPALRQPDLQDAAFVPVCLPHVSPTAFLHACVGCLCGAGEGGVVASAAASGTTTAAATETRVQMFAVLIAQTPDASPRMAAACRQLEAALRHVGALPAAAVAAASALRSRRGGSGIEEDGDNSAASATSPLPPGDPSLPPMLWHYCLRYPARQQLVSAPFTAGPFAIGGGGNGEDDDRLSPPHKLRREAYRAYASLHALMYGGGGLDDSYWPPAAVGAGAGGGGAGGGNAAAHAPHPHYSRQARPAAERAAVAASVAAASGGPNASAAAAAAASSAAAAGSGGGVAAAAAALFGLSANGSAAAAATNLATTTTTPRLSPLSPPLATAAFVRGDRWAAVAVADDEDSGDEAASGVEAYALLDPLATRDEALAAAALLRRLYSAGSARAAAMLVSGI